MEALIKVLSMEKRRRSHGGKAIQWTDDGGGLNVFNICRTHLAGAGTELKVEGIGRRMDHVTCIYRSGRCKS